MPTESSVHMGLVETVSGPVPVESLGLTLTHEHIVLLETEIEVNRIGRWRDEVEIPAATESLRLAKAAGVDTLADLTAIGRGRNVAPVARIAAGTGLNVLVATGIYAFDAGSYVGMDRLGYDVKLAPEKRLRTVAGLVRRGYADRLLLSHDSPCY